MFVSVPQERVSLWLATGRGALACSSSVQLPGQPVLQHRLSACATVAKEKIKEKKELVSDLNVKLQDKIANCAFLLVFE